LYIRFFASGQVYDELAELVGVARTLGTLWGHDASMAARTARASGAEFQTEALPDFQTGKAIKPSGLHERAVTYGIPVTGCCFSFHISY
jgi:hypothetical protein